MNRGRRERALCRALLGSESREGEGKGEGEGEGEGEGDFSLNCWPE